MFYFTQEETKLTTNKIPTPREVAIAKIGEPEMNHHVTKTFYIDM
jgi:hypothetical protein